MTQTYLEVHNLCKTFTAKNGSVEALKGVSLSIGKGEIFGVIGLFRRGQEYAGAMYESAGTPRQRGRSAERRKSADS